MEAAMATVAGDEDWAQERQSDGVPWRQILRTMWARARVM
jgi:hypothetical protein